MVEDIFDIYNIVVNELVGDIWLTVLLGLFLTIFVAIKLKMPMQVGLILGVLWLIIMFAGASINLLIIWVYVVLFAGTFFYYSLSRAFKRG